MILPGFVITVSQKNLPCWSREDERNHGNAGTQHNVIPDRCTFVVDIRSNECYSNQELFDEIQKHITCEAKARSFRLSSSHVAPEHPVVQKAIA